MTSDKNLALGNIGHQHRPSRPLDNHHMGHMNHTAHHSRASTISNYNASNASFTKSSVVSQKGGKSDFNSDFKSKSSVASTKNQTSSRPRCCYCWGLFATWGPARYIIISFFVDMGLEKFIYKLFHFLKKSRSEICWSEFINESIH